MPGALDIDRTVEEGRGPSTDPATTRIRLVLVDDHELVRYGIRAVIEAEPDLKVVGEAGTATEGIRRIAFEEPDVVVLDVNLPDGSGVEVCRRIRAVSPHSRVLMLTAFADEATLAAAREAGAAGFILKRVQNFDLVSHIRRVAGGGTAFGDAPIPKPDKRPDDPLLARLTDRERVILQLVAEGKTNREIADDLFLAEKTVKNYVSNLLMKMGIRHRAGAAAHLARIQGESNRPYPPSDWRHSP